MVLNFSPSISINGGTSTPLNIVEFGMSATFSSSVSPGISEVPNLASEDSAIATDAKSVQSKEIGKRRMLMGLPRSPEAGSEVKRRDRRGPA